MDDEIEYRYVKGSGWVAGYKAIHPDHVPRQAAKVANFGFPTGRVYYNPFDYRYADLI